jgi:Ca2+-binding EF-hand superfamily protein
MRDIVQQVFECKRVLKESKTNFKEKQLDFHRIFEKIDSQRKGFLMKNDFLDFLQDGIPEFREGEFQELSIFTQKCDLDNDGKVTFKDFYMFFSL